jgi:hypothetical protein
MQIDKICCYGICGDKFRCQKKIQNNKFYCVEHKYQRNDFHYFSDIMKILLDEVNKLKTSGEKFEKVCQIFEFSKYNRNIVNSYSQRFNGIVNKKLDELLVKPFILKNKERIDKIKNYKKYFVWMDLEEEEVEKIYEYPKISIDVSQKIVL